MYLNTIALTIVLFGTVYITNLSFVDKKFKQSFIIYTAGFCFLVSFSVIWGIAYFNKREFLVFGFFLISLGFSLLTKTRYFLSLLRFEKTSYTFFIFYKENSRYIHSTLLGGALCIFTACIFAPYVIPPLVDLLYPILRVPLLAWFLFFWLVVFLFLTLPFPDVKLQAVFNSLRFISNKYFRLKRGSKKVLLFFRKFPINFRNFFPSILGFVSLINQNLPFYLVLSSFSLKYNQGLYLYFWLVFVLNLTFFVTLPRVRGYIFKVYGPNSLRMLVWNGPEVPFVKIVGTAAGVAATVIIVGYANESIKRANINAQDAHEAERRERYNQEARQRQLEDQAGAAAGKYALLGPGERVPNHGSNTIIDVAKSGADAAEEGRRMSKN